MSLPQNIIVENNWQCPHCSAWSSLEEFQHKKSNIGIDENADKLSDLTVHVVICKNIKCQKATITADLIGMVPYKGM
jgi:predicted ATP-dependent serine protease